MRYLKGRLETLEDKFSSLDFKKNPESFHQLMKEYETLPQDVQILHDDVESKASSEDLGALKTEVEKLMGKLDKFSSLQAKVDTLGDFNPQDLQQQIIEVQSEINAEKQRAEAAEKKIKDDFDAGIAAQKGIIDQLKALLQTQNDKFDVLNQVVTNHTDQIQAHDAKFNKVDGFEDKLTLMQNSFDELKNEHDGYKVRIEALEKIKDNFDLIFNDVNVDKQQYNNLKTQLSKVEENLKNQVKKFEELQNFVNGTDDYLAEQSGLLRKMTEYVSTSIMGELNTEKERMRAALKQVTLMCLESDVNVGYGQDERHEAFKGVSTVVLWELESTLNWNSLSEDAFKLVLVRRDDGTFIKMEEYVGNYRGKNMFGLFARKYSYDSFIKWLKNNGSTELTIRDLLIKLDEFFKS